MRGLVPPFVYLHCCTVVVQSGMILLKLFVYSKVVLDVTIAFVIVRIARNGGYGLDLGSVSVILFWFYSFVSTLILLYFTI